MRGDASASIIYLTADASGSNMAPMTLATAKAKAGARWGARFYIRVTMCEIKPPPDRRPGVWRCDGFHNRHPITCPGGVKIYDVGETREFPFPHHAIEGSGATWEEAFAQADAKHPEQAA